MTGATSWRSAELAAADYLFASGFEVLGRNVRLGPLELDIVARAGKLVVVAEVRTRGPGAFERPFESISWRKRRSLRRAIGRLWESQLARLDDVDRVRLDAIAVHFQQGKTYVESAQGIAP
ncbi:MAG: YraN family protein [Polyangiaceae bacterium]